MPTEVKPVGLLPPPKRAPRKLNTTEDLRTLQRLMTHVLARPLNSRDGMQTRWIDGRNMAEVAESFIKPNDRLTAFERLELYNRQYWFRLLDCFYDDNPGLRAILGTKRFTALAEAYIAKYPSRSFSLRNLCGRLAQFLSEHPSFSRPHTILAIDMARFEWAQILAFDEASLPVLTPDQFTGVSPSRLRIALQPYVSLLELDHAVDDFLLAVKHGSSQQGKASNAMRSAPTLAKQGITRRPRRKKIHVAVHRVDNELYYKRLEPEAYYLLVALRDGATVQQAMSTTLTNASSKISPPALADKIQSWFKLWMQLGWLCAPLSKPRK